MLEELENNYRQAAAALAAADDYCSPAAVAALLAQVQRTFPVHRTF